MRGFEGWLLVAHVLAAMTWVGGTVVLGALGTAVLRAGDADGVARFTAMLRRVGPVVLAPSPVILLGAGIWLAVRSPAWDLGQLWLQLAFGLFAAAFVVGAAHQSRTAIAAERRAKAGAAGPAADQLRRWVWGARAIAALQVAATAVMVLKPGL